MKIAFIRTKVQSTVFLDEPNGRPSGEALDAATLEKMKITAKAGSSSKNVMFGLEKYGLVECFEEWKFWAGEFTETQSPDGFPVKIFPTDAAMRSEYLKKYIAENGQPDILWIEGQSYPPYIDQIFSLCPESFKMLYSKDWEPWKVEQVGLYDLVMVDEEIQAQRIQKKHPNVYCGLWNKFIDHESTHFPLDVEKKYDVCYVAYLRVRKNHELLLKAAAKLPDRNLNIVCLGEDRKNYRAKLEKMVDDLGLDVTFVGEVGKGEVNQYINQSRMGVMTSVLDAVPRATLEYMAADVPVLVNAHLRAGTRYVGEQGGLVKAPEEFHRGIEEILDNPERFSPRAFFMENFSFEKNMAVVIDIFKKAGLPLLVNGN